VLHWRTVTGKEVDSVIELQGRLMPIEVKTTSRPRLADTDGFNHGYTGSGANHYPYSSHAKPRRTLLCSQMIGAFIGVNLRGPGSDFSSRFRAAA